MLKVKNWDTFQHYKDRDPPWIKLHRGLLEDYEFTKLPDVSKGHLVLIWILASRCGNRIPNDPSWVKSRIGASKDVDLKLLIGSGFLEEADGEERSRSEGWGSRYIPDEIRSAVMARDGGACKTCGVQKNLEIDHVIPVSKGGSSEAENLQVLCRSCNRSKRAKSVEQVATQKKYLRSSEGEGEGETEERRGRDSSAPQADAEPALLSFPCVGTGASEWHLTQSAIEAWSDAWPGVDVLQESKKALAWLNAKPERRKTHRGMPAFLTGWYGRAQNNSAGLFASKGTSRERPGPAYAKLTP